MNDLKPRETIVRVRVKWDAAREDHPLAWDWSGRLNCEATVLDFYDEGESYVEPPQPEKRRRSKGG